MKLLLVSLGCDKNLVDSEEMTGILAGQGFEFTDDERAAEVIVVITRMQRSFQLLRSVM